MKKYFQRLLGNAETKERLGRAIDTNSLAHAFLISGPSGSGKTTLATEICAALNCLERGSSSALPCGICNNCKRIYEGNFPDVKILAKQKDKATLGVDPVKDFREDMFLSTTESEYKIYLIDDAECMTLEAQNALLKVLEEPPNKVVIMLLATECDKILSTIKSRTQFIPMTRFSEEDLYEELIKLSDEARLLKKENEEKLKNIVVSADGRLGQGLKLLSRRSAAENEEEREEIKKIISSLAARVGYGEIYRAITALPDKRQALIEALERLMVALRDLIVIKKSENVHLLFFSSKRAVEDFPDISLKRLIFAYDAVSEAHLYCTRNANVQNLLVNLTAKLALGAGV